MLSRHLTKQGTVVWADCCCRGVFFGENASEALRLNRVCCDCLQLWQAGRLALMEVQEVLENVSQWLTLTEGPMGA